jgi:hypothetical protein
MCCVRERPTLKDETALRCRYAHSHTHRQQNGKREHLFEWTALFSPEQSQNLLSRADTILSCGALLQLPTQPAGRLKNTFEQGISTFVQQVMVNVVKVNGLCKRAGV